MAIKKFTDFDNKPSLEDADYIVGYKADGTAEYKTTLSSLVGYLEDFFPARTPFMYDFAPGEVFEFTKHDIANSYYIDWVGDVRFHTNYPNNTITMLDRDKLIYIKVGVLGYIRDPDGFSQPVDVDLSNCTSLSAVDMYLNVNCFKTINFSGCTSLEHISLRQNWYGTTDVDITNCLKLRYLNLITNLNLSGIQADIADSDLEYVDLGGAYSPNIDFLSQKSKLKTVGVQDSNLANLDISSSYGGIVHLDASFNRISQTDIENILIGIDNAQPASVTPTLQQGLMTYSLLLSGSNDVSNDSPSVPTRLPFGSNGTPTSSAALAAKASLISKGWTVQTN